MKPIDLLKMQNTPKCEYCTTNMSTGDGISLITCGKSLLSRNFIPLALTTTGAEPCTPEDWKVCPLNK